MCTKIYHSVFFSSSLLFTIFVIVDLKAEGLSGHQEQGFIRKGESHRMTWPRDLPPTLAMLQQKACVMPLWLFPHVLI